MGGGESEDSDGAACFPDFENRDAEEDNMSMTSIDYVYPDILSVVAPPPARYSVSYRPDNHAYWDLTNHAQPKFLTDIFGWKRNSATPSPIPRQMRHLSIRLLADRGMSRFGWAYSEIF